MATPGTGALRALRVLLLALTVVGLSLLAHDLGGGARPDLAPLVVIAVLTALAVRPMTRHQLAMPRLLGLLGAGQVVLHVVFEQCAALSVVPGGAPHHHPPDAGSVLWMIGAHAAATLVVAFVLRHGDGVLWRLWAWLAGRRLPAGAPVVVVAPARPAYGALPVAHVTDVRGAVRGRAPPALV